MSIQDTIDTAIGAVITNASNYPTAVQTRILGQDMGPLRTRLTQAVISALTTANSRTQDNAASALAGEDGSVDCPNEAHRWQYRGVACEPDTGDTYDSTRAFDTSEEAEQAARDWGLLDGSPELPQLILRVERRLKAGPWGASPEHVEESTP